MTSKRLLAVFRGQITGDGIFGNSAIDSQNLNMAGKRLLAVVRGQITGDGNIGSRMASSSPDAVDPMAGFDSEFIADFVKYAIGNKIELDDESLTNALESWADDYLEAWVENQPTPD